jgi:DNA-binding PadR family transcriptional regulator
MWGYRIKQKVEVDFGVTLRHGALYPLLIKLEQNDFLTSQEQLQGGRTRKVYSITEKGNDYLRTYNGVIREQLE